MRFSVYRKAFLFGLRQVTNYRVDTLISILSKIVSLLGVVFLWSIIGKSEGISGVESLMAYFLIANGVQGLVDGESLRFSKEINANVKQGTLSAVLLRPTNPIIYMYSNFLGGRGVNISMQLILICLGFVFLGGVSIIQIDLFFVSVLVAFVVAFVFNLFIGSMSFWTSEANHLQNVMSHILRVFSGVLIPISFFPETAKKILMYSPFPVLGYLPSVVLQKNMADTEVIMTLASSIIWSIILLPICIWFWKRGVKRYEAIGI